MRHLSLAEAIKTFDVLFAAATQEMFKAEVLQDYTAVDESPSLQAWLAGDAEKSRALGRQDENIIAYRNKCLQSPASITRVHVVKAPYTPYLEWEITVCYKDSLLAHGAESISLAETRQVPDIELPAGDFWIFDDRCVLQWEYENGNGKTTGARLWDEDEGDDIDRFRHLKQALLAAATHVHD